MKKVYLRPDINVATVSVFCSDVIVASGETEVFDIWGTNLQEGAQI